MLCLIFLSLPFYFASFEIPKRIINEAIQGTAFANGQTTASFMKLSFAWPEWLGGGVLNISNGLQLGRVDLLLALSTTFLVFVIINGSFKQIINTAKGILGERMLRRMRFDLFALFLRLRPESARALKPSEAVSIINTEVEPIGGFIGDAFIQPSFLMMQAVTALVFIALQNFWLGFLALSVVLVQAFVIPELRKEILRLSRERQIETRTLMGRLGELVETAPVIHTHGAAAYTKADIGQRLGSLFDIRVKLFRRKFGVKFLNNLLAQVTPFFFYIIGGYLVIIGKLDIGQLVAAIAAYRDLPPPIKDLIDWDQARSDVIVKYQQIVAQFPPETILPATIDATAALPGVDAPIVTRSLRLVDRFGQPLLDQLSVTLSRPAHCALVGPTGSGKDFLARIIARQISQYQGSVSIGGVNIATLTDRDAVQMMSYAGPDPLLFHGSIRQNVILALVKPQFTPEDMPGDEAERRRRMEAQRSGNPSAVFSDAWIDAAKAGEDAAAIDKKIMASLELAGIGAEVYRLGLKGRVDVRSEPERVAGFLDARKTIQRKLKERSLEQLIEPFDPARFNRNTSIAENLLFGVRTGDYLAEDILSTDPFFRSILEAEALLLPLAEIGLRLAESVIELFVDLPPGNPLFERFSFVRADTLPEIMRSVDAVRTKGGLKRISPGDLSGFLNLALSYVEPKMRLGLISPLLEERIIRARHSFRAYLPQAYLGEVEFYEKNQYLSAAPIIDNLLFGRITYGVANAEARVNAIMIETLRALDLERVINHLGLDYDVGQAGNQLFPPQRAAVALARALVCEAEILIIDGALNSLPPREALETLSRIRTAMQGRTLIVTASEPDDVEDFDQILMFSGPALMASRGGSHAITAPEQTQEQAAHAAG